jgi:hypothetical protein
MPTAARAAALLAAIKRHWLTWRVQFSASARREWQAGSIVRRLDMTEQLIGTIARNHAAEECMCGSRAVTLQDGDDGAFNTWRATQPDAAPSGLLLTAKDHATRSCPVR